MKSFSIVLLSCLISISAAWAQADRTQRQAGDSEVPVLSGGIGIAERQALAESARDYNLKLVFTLASGNYLSDVSLEIANAAGRPVVQHVAYGPFAYVKLQPGKYHVKATFEGAAQTKQITVDGRQRTLHFRWQLGPRRPIG